MDFDCGLGARIGIRPEINYPQPQAGIGFVAHATVAGAVLTARKRGGSLRESSSAQELREQILAAMAMFSAERKISKRRAGLARMYRISLVRRFGRQIASIALEEQERRHQHEHQQRKVAVDVVE
jgi:hypothetical protein